MYLPTLVLPIVSILIVTFIVFLSEVYSHHPILSKSGGKMAMDVAFFLSKFIRLIIYVLALLWVFLLYILALRNFPNQLSPTLVRWYGLTALFLLYLVLTPGLLSVFFPKFWLNSLIVISRRALGVSMFFFALFHAILAFSYHFKGSVFTLFGLPPAYKLATIFGVAALLILFIMAVTAFDKSVAFLKYKHWKRIHRLLYPASILILFHALIRGSDFVHQTNLKLLVIFLSLTYIQLEAEATYIILSQNFKKRPIWKTAVYYFLLATLVFFSFYFGYKELDRVI